MLAILLLILVPEALVTVVEINASALNEGCQDVSSGFQGISIRDDQCGVFARFQRADPIGDSQNLCRIEGNRSQCFFERQAVCGRHGGVVGQVSHVGCAESASVCNAKFDSRLTESLG